MLRSTFWKRLKLKYMGAAKQNHMLEKDEFAPDFALSRLSDGILTRADLAKQGPAVIAFFKTSCPVCQFTFPYLDRLHKAGRIPIYGVSQDDPEATTQFNQEFGVTFPILLDTEESGYPASNGFGINFVPSVFLIEPDGRIGWSMEGFERKALEELGKRTGATPFRADEKVPEHKSG